jgi:hypothetical protein
MSEIQLGIPAFMILDAKERVVARFIERILKTAQSFDFAQDSEPTEL